MKNKTAIFFILIANIIILAHAAIPHRHFPYPEIIDAQCDANNHYHHHDLEAADLNHHHHNDNDDENDDYDRCLLNKIISVPKSTAKAADYNTDNLDLGFSGFNAELLFFKFEFVVTSVTVRLRPPNLNFSYISYASSVLGLRAPPAI